MDDEDVSSVNNAASTYLPQWLSNWLVSHNPGGGFSQSVFIGTQLAAIQDLIGSPSTSRGKFQGDAPAVGWLKAALFDWRPPTS